MIDPLRDLLTGLHWRQVDVFARQPLSGNGLAVFPDAAGLTAPLMLSLARETRQFESIFLTATDTPGTFAARMFTVEEELDFAGHPVLGAACVLHERFGADRDQCAWTLRLPAKDTEVLTTRREHGYEAEMDQGRPEFGPPLPPETLAPLLAAQGLAQDDLAPDLPAQVVSTGLPYLVVPLRSGLDRARPADPAFGALLAAVGAKFCYPLHIPTREGRSWDNHGLLEDPATGSAAGPAGAYLVHHAQAEAETTITIHQGRFVHRPSQIQVLIQGPAAAPTRALVSGDVTMTAHCRFD